MSVAQAPRTSNHVGHGPAENSGKFGKSLSKTTTLSFLSFVNFWNSLIFLLAKISFFRAFFLFQGFRGSVGIKSMFFCFFLAFLPQKNNGGAPKERRRRRAEKRLSKRVFLESLFFLCPLKVFRTFQVKANLKGAEKKRTLQKHPFGQPFLRTTPSPLLRRDLKQGKEGQGTLIHSIPQVATFAFTEDQRGHAWGMCIWAWWGCMDKHACNYVPQSVPHSCGLCEPKPR